MPPPQSEAIGSSVVHRVKQTIVLQREAEAPEATLFYTRCKARLGFPVVAILDEVIQHVLVLFEAIPVRECDQDLFGVDAYFPVCRLDQQGPQGLRGPLCLHQRPLPSRS